MTVGEDSGYLGYEAATALGSISTGAKFNYPPWNPPHKHHFDPDYEFTVAYLYINTAIDKVGIQVSEAGAAGGANLGNITLWIRNTSFPLVGFGTSGADEFAFDIPDGPDLDWSEGDKVSVVLSYERRLPSEPRNVSVTAPPGEDGTLEVSWEKPKKGTFPIECYLVEFRHPSGEAKKRKQSYPGSLGPGKGCGDRPPTSVRRTDLETGVEYQVLVQALSGDGYSEWSEMKTARTGGRSLRAWFESPPERHDGGVKGWRGAVRVRCVFVPLAFARCKSGSRRSVSTPCSSNRTCGFPASGSQLGSRLRPRKVSCRQRKAREAALLPQPSVGKSHVFS